MNDSELQEMVDNMKMVGMTEMDEVVFKVLAATADLQGARAEVLAGMKKLADNMSQAP